VPIGFAESAAGEGPKEVRGGMESGTGELGGARSRAGCGCESGRRSIAGGRWSRGTEKRCCARAGSTHTRASGALARMNARQAVLVSASAIGISATAATKL